MSFDRVSDLHGRLVSCFRHSVLLHPCRKTTTMCEKCDDAPGDQTANWCTTPPNCTEFSTRLQAWPGSSCKQKGSVENTLERTRMAGRRASCLNCTRLHKILNEMQACTRPQQDAILVQDPCFVSAELKMGHRTRTLLLVLFVRFRHFLFGHHHDPPHMQQLGPTPQQSSEWGRALQKQTASLSPS